MEGDTKKLIKTFLVRPAIMIVIAGGAYLCAKCNSQQTGRQTMNKTLKEYLVKPAAGLAATLYGCQEATARTESYRYSFNEIGRKTEAFSCESDYTIRAIYTAYLDGDQDIVKGIGNCPYTLENKVQQKQIGDK